MRVAAEREQAMPAFGRMLRGARLELGLTCREMGARVGMTPQYVSEVELGKRQVPRRVLDRLIRSYKLHAVSAVAFWLEERCRHDRVLRTAREPLTFMQRCRRRRLELGLSHAAVEQRSGVGSLAEREAGTRLPPRPPAAARLLAALQLPAELVANALHERVAHRQALFLPSAAPGRARRSLARQRRAEGAA